MYGILGEDDSDVDTLKVLVKRLARNQSLRVKGKGFDGCSKMLQKGAGYLKSLRDLDFTKFVICHDADGADPHTTHNEVMDQIVRPAAITENYCIVIPVQEIEAWILADIECATEVFSSWKPKPKPISNPEGIASPKEHLITLSKDSQHKPRYSPPTHNQRMAEHLDLDTVKKKCPSFQVLADFVA